MKLLVTGGAGFIGSNFVRYWAETYPKDSIINLDALTYAGCVPSGNDGGYGRNVQFVKGNILDQKLTASLMKNADVVFHFAAETHVDRSILDSQIFLKTNVLGTQNLLEAARQNHVRKFVYVSTDEVYGSVKRGSFREDSPLKPNSPYAASKAAGDLVCRSYWITHKMPVIVTRCSNNYGPYQFPEKAIPLFITNLLEGRKVPLYGKGENIREWIYVVDHCRALDLVSRKGKAGEIYNIGSGAEVKNIHLVRTILKIMGKSEKEIEFVKDRPGHDFRYSLNSKKIEKLGWKPKYKFSEALAETVDWYRNNESWWMKIKKNSEYKKYVKKQYR